MDRLKKWKDAILGWLRAHPRITVCLAAPLLLTLIPLALVRDCLNGVFSLPNVLRQCEQPHEVGGVRDPRVNKALDDDLQPLGTGNPKTLFYTTTA